MVKGSCLCGGIRFEVDEVALLTHCHCSDCRKLSGAAFCTYAHVVPEKFRFVKGENLIARYEYSPGRYRSFCRVCSSPAPGKAQYSPTVSIPAGTLDSDPGARPALHTFVSSRVPWWEINDELPRFEKWVPGYEPRDRS
jgi:hypothetical protein